MNSKGFTLLETTIAMFLLAIGLLAVAYSLTFALRANSVSRTLGLASPLTLQKLEQFKSLPFTHPQLAEGGNLTADSPDHFDRLDLRGQPATSDSAVGYIRRWQITSTSPTLKTISVRVIAQNATLGRPPVITYSTARSTIR